MVDKARRTAWVCQECGRPASGWLGQCPGCGAWNAIVEEPVAEPRARSPRAPAAVRPLVAVAAGEALRRTTGLAELDRVLGGGLVQGSVVLVGGDPGIGKSTLALQARFWIPEKLAYKGQSPPYGMLVFDVELIKIE